MDRIMLERRIKELARAEKSERAIRATLEVAKDELAVYKAAVLNAMLDLDVSQYTVGNTTYRAFPSKGAELGRITSVEVKDGRITSVEVKDGRIMTVDEARPEDRGHTS